jgi:hypothetical protein
MFYFDKQQSPAFAIGTIVKFLPKLSCELYQFAIDDNGKDSHDWQLGRICADSNELFCIYLGTFPIVDGQYEKYVRFLYRGRVCATNIDFFSQHFEEVLCP